MQQFHEKLINDLDINRFNQIYENLHHQTGMMPVSSEEAHNDASEQTLIRKASEVEQLVLRL